MTSLRRPPRGVATRAEVDEQTPLQDLLTLADGAIGGLVRPGEPLDFARRPGATAILLPGDHGDLLLDVVGARVVAMPGVTAKRLLVLRDAQVSGLRVAPSAWATQPSVDVRGCVATLVDVHATGNKGAALALDATASAVVTGCTLLRATAGASLATMAAGARALFVGCLLGPASSGLATCVNNLGAAADCHLTGVLNLTGAPNLNVTTVSEVT